MKKEAALVAIITGPTSGIGLEVARNLARSGATLVLACRDRDRGERVCAELAAEPGAGRLELMELDVASIASVRAFASAVAERFAAVHVLVNNAGAWFSRRRESTDGVELSFATNALGAWLLTRLLRGPLAAGRARVINVGSHLAGGLDLDDPEWQKRPYRGFSGAYSESKQALLMLSQALAEELRADGVTVNVAEPGWVRTNAHRDAFFLQRFVMNLAGSIGARRPAQGADTPSWMAVAPELEGVTGARYQDRQLLPASFGEADAIARLVAYCEERVRGITEPVEA